MPKKTIGKMYDALYPENTKVRNYHNDTSMPNNYKAFEKQYRRNLDAIKNYCVNKNYSGNLYILQFHLLCLHKFSDRFPLNRSGGCNCCGDFIMSCLRKELPGISPDRLKYKLHPSLKEMDFFLSFFIEPEDEVKKLLDNADQFKLSEFQLAKITCLYKDLTNNSLLGEPLEIFQIFVQIMLHP